MPRVSVIVPNYNHAPYLKQRFDSIFNQTFQDFEVIILDDCSTDNSKEIIEQYRSNPKVSHVIYNEKNSGSPFKQWAKGFELARGEYIWIAESDDWAEVEFLEILVPLLNTNKKVALAFCASNWVYPNHVEKKGLYTENCEISGTNFIKSKMSCGNSIHNASAVIFRRENIKFIPDNYINFKGSGDYQFWVNLCETGKLFFVTAPLNNFRRYEENTTQKCNSSGRTYIEDLNIFKYIDQKKYLSSFEKECIVSFYLAKIKRSPNPEDFTKAFNMWKKETGHPIFFQSFCFLIGLCLRISPTFLKKHIEKKLAWSYYYDNYNTLELIWNTFHLPNTNLKKINREI